MKLPWVNKRFSHSLTHSLTPPICKHDQIKMRDYTNEQAVYPTKAGYLTYLGSPTSMTKPLD